MTAFNYEIAVRARKEILDAWRWYEDRQAGLGDRFLGSVEERIAQIVQAPERFPAKKKSFREARVKVFPYLIIFRIAKRKNVIIIISVFHASRNPELKYSTKVKKR